MDNENSQKEPASKIETPTPKSKFEDSPVFNFINNLSPFEPVKSFSSAQTFSSLSFTSPPPPVFASPHPIFHRESRFFRCQHSVDRSKALGDGSVSKEDREVDLNKDATLEDDEEEDTETSCELPQILSSDGQSPPHHGDNIVTQTLLPPSDPPLGEDNNGSSMNRLQKIPDSQEEENGTPDSRRLMADAAAELLVFRSPNDSEAFTCLVDKISSSERRLFAGVKHHDIIPANGSSNDNEPLAVVPNQLVSNVHRGSMRRRCLDFEVPGKRKKDDDQQTVCDNNKPESSSSKCVVPGIGLHLNAIAMASRNTKISITHEYSSSEEVQNTFSGSITPVHSQDTVPETLDQAESQPGEEAPKALVFEELIPDSLQKKKQVLEGGEGEGESSCKRCNCKKSKCLKLYCECFAAGVYCIEPCSCVDCFNKPIHEDTVLATRKQIESRNPLAFAPKVIRNSDSSIMDTSDDASKTPASARHKRGCNCKKSNCLKKYCECYQSGVGCSINCRCEGCKNAFGRKDAYLHTIMESKQEDDHETYEKRTEKIQQNSKEVEQNPQPSTPLPPYRNLVVHQPFLSRNKLPPTQFFLGAGSSSFRKPDCDVTQSMNDKKSLETVTEDKTEIMPDILNTSPIKANSPNSKRVSPAHIGPSEPGSILGKRSNGRKLILRSIPAFPSLNPNQ